MQWEETSPENQEDQIEAFFPTKERREAVTNNPVENNVCVWLSPLQRLGDAYFPSEEEAIVGMVKPGGYRQVVQQDHYKQKRHSPINTSC